MIGFLKKEMLSIRGFENGETMFEIKIDGIKEAQDNLRKMEKKIKELEGKKTITLDELFNRDFMKHYTDYDNFDDFVLESKLIPEGTKSLTQDIFEAIPDNDFDKYIAKTTKFKSWEHMKQVAVDEYYKNQLDL